MTAVEEAPPDSSHVPLLRRQLGTSGLVIHYVTSVMGAGVLLIPALAWRVAGPLSLLAWGLLILYSFPFALVFARLSTLHPTSKGVARFVEAAFGPRAGRISAVFLLLTLLAGNPVLGLAAGRYLLAAVDPGASNRAALLAGAAVIVCCVLVNLLGIKVSTRAQTVVLATVVLLLAVVICLALPQGDYTRLAPVAPHGWGALGSALLICFFGFIGWENAAPVAEEVRDPERTFPRGILYAVSCVGVLYFAMALAVAVALPGTGGDQSDLTAFVRLLEVATGTGLRSGGYLLAGVLLLLTTNAWCLGTSRVVFALARDGILPRGLSKLAPRRHLPARAVLALLPGYAVSVVALFVTDSSEASLIKASSATYVLIFLMAFVSAVRLLPRGPVAYANLAVVAVTVAMLPFFGSSVVIALAVLLVSVVAERWLRRRVTPPNERGTPT
ncbi:APC family permease [Streptomyces luteocolor]|uniref:APC family permease n=1 Tax=Streptomyces luteocolor TaxID=285500 RepID=UPI000853452C|nr:amino acid permease [Streptomyces luteocolor]